MSVRVVFSMVCIALGLLVVGISILGLFRFRDALARLHAGALTDTLGLLLIILGIVILCGFSAHTAKLMVLVVIFWITNPVSSHLIARMELITGKDLEPDHFTGEGEMDL